MTPRLWTYDPNWERGVTETLAWKTDIKKSRTGKEVRTRLRHHPRRGLDFSTVEIDRPYRDLDADLWGTSVEDWIVPLWWDVAHPTGFNEGANEYAGEALDPHRDFRAGGYIAVTNGSEWGYFEISYITAGIGDDRLIAVTEEPPESLKTGVKIYPAYPAALTSADVERVTAGVSTASVSFELIDYRHPDGVSPFSQYQSLDLFDDRPDRMRPIGRQYDRQIETIGTDYGSVSRYDDPARPFIDVDRIYLYTTLAEMWERRLWWQSLGGAHRAFWAPTWDRDLVVVEPGGGVGNDELIIEPIQWSDRYGGETGRSDVYLRTRNNDPAARRIDFAFVSGDAEYLFSESGDWGDEFDAADVLQCSWLERVRLSGDAIEIPWISPGVAKVNLPMKVLDDDL